MCRAMSTVQRKRAARIGRILDAAARQFAARGFHATRMEDIAAELDLQKGALYYYFDSKEALLTKLVEGRVGTAVAALREIVESPTPPLDKVRRAIASHLTVFQEHADLYRIFSTERLSSISVVAAETVDAVGREYEGLWATLVEEGMARRALRRDLDVPLTVKAIVGMCNSTLFWLRPDGRLSTASVAAEFADLVVSGIAAE